MTCSFKAVEFAFPLATDFSLYLTKELTSHTTFKCLVRTHLKTNATPKQAVETSNRKTIIDQTMSIKLPKKLVIQTDRKPPANQVATQRPPDWLTRVTLG